MTRRATAGRQPNRIFERHRFPSRDHFASYNGTAPVEVSSGNRKIYRLSLRGNRRINHALHMAAITQIRHRHSDGRAYYDRKIAEGKTHKEALRCLKRRISDAIFARLQADARRAASTPQAAGPGGHRGTTLPPARLAHTPQTSSSGKPLPSPVQPYDPPPRASEPCRQSRHPRKLAKILDSNTKEDSFWRRLGRPTFHACGAPNRCYGLARCRSARSPSPLPVPLRCG
jgi:transposase